MPSTRITTLAIGLACIVGYVTPVEAESVDDNSYTTSDFYISSIDGTPLHTVLFRPANAPAKTPVILEVTPYLTSGGRPFQPEGAVNQDIGYEPGNLGSLGRIFAKGYSYMIVALRGFGASGGCYDYGGPGEQMDVVAAVKWAARQPWSSGKVGMWGNSYRGWTQLMALAARNDGKLGDELAAVIPKSPPTGFLDSYTARVNPVRHAIIGHGIAADYAVSDLQGPSVFDTPERQATALGGTLSDPACYPDGTIGSLSDDPNSPYWAARDLVDRAAGSTVPTLWIQGFNDWNVRPNGMPALFPTLCGPQRGIVGPWDHDMALSGTGADWYELAVQWYDRWLKDDRSVQLGPQIRVQSVNGNWHSETSWPPTDATYYDLPLLDGVFVDVAGNNGETGLPDNVSIGDLTPQSPLPTGTGSWTFSPPLPHDVHVAGLTRLSATVHSLVPNVHLVALVYDVDPSGSATFVDRGAVRVPRAGPISFELYPQDWTFPRDHRIGVLISGADDVWFEPGTSATPVSFSGARLSLPVVPSLRPDTTGPFIARGPHGASIPVDTTNRTVDWSVPPPATSATPDVRSDTGLVSRRTTHCD